MGNVLKINIKGSGYVHRWNTPYPLLQRFQVDEMLARPGSEETGPNLAYRCECIDPSRFLVSVASVWDECDEFGRRGLSLCDGRVVELDVDAGDRVGVLVKEFFSIMAGHREYYEWIGRHVEALSLDADLTRVKELQQKLYPIRATPDKYTYQLVEHISRAILGRLHRDECRLCLTLDYPWDDQVAFACLIGALGLLGKSGSAHGGSSRPDSRTIFATRRYRGFVEITVSPDPISPDAAQVSPHGTRLKPPSRRSIWSFSRNKGMESEE